MKAPLNRRVFVIGYGAATALGKNLADTWQRAVTGQAGFRTVTRCQVDCLSHVVGEIPDWQPQDCPFFSRRDAYNWNAAFVPLTMTVCHDAIQDAGWQVDWADRTGCLIGSALNGSDSLRIAMTQLLTHGPLKVSPYLLPNICANLPAGKAGMQFGFTGPLVSPQSACASGNHAIGLGARLIRDGDCDFVLAGGVDTGLIPEIMHGFANMNATIKIAPRDRAAQDPAQASRPFSIDRRGMVLAEGAAVLVLAAEEAVLKYGLSPRAEVLGIGWNSDAHHFTAPHAPAIVTCIQAALDDAQVSTTDIDYISAHATSTAKGDRTEIECLRRVFGQRLASIPISANKSQIGHTLGAAAAIEAVLGIEAMRRQTLLPTINHIADPELGAVDVIPNTARRQACHLLLSNAFGFGGTNCCVVFKRV